MKASFALPLLLLLTFSGTADAAISKGSLDASNLLSPVTRVVELLKGLSKKVEEESKKEEDLYETFVCWAKSIISQKTESNTASQSRIDMLKAYIADLDAGRIELTSERKDLETEIETLHGDIEVATETRNKENEEYEEAKAEMQQAIDALEEALEVLRTATEGHEEGVLVSLKGQLNEGYSVRAKQAALLNHAVELGNKVLTKGDAIFLSRVLTGEVPKPDWKKLNRKANFKKSYKGRSFKIQGVLAKLLETFATNLQEATNAEEKAKATFDKLMTSKNEELTAAQDALAKLSGENGAKGMSKQESQDEVDKLTTEVENDTKYIQQVKDALEEKKTEWKGRKELRAGELAAISKAISILHSDDARDLFKKSFSSQDKSATMFLQESSMSTAMVRLQHAAITELRVTAKVTKDTRLSQLAARLASKGHFDDVISAIDSMVETLKDEEAGDLEKKETCESDRAADTREAVLDSRSIDEMTDAITVLKSEIEDLAKEIEEKEAGVVKIEEELDEMKEIRDKENAEYLVAKKDDEDAAALVEDAKNVMESFYTENGLKFMQKDTKKKQPFESTAGEAPPPPPPTWEGSYGGKQGESDGIVSILTLIHDDIMKDVAKATKEEEDSLEMYTTSKKSMEDEISDLNSQITEHENTKSGKEGEVETTKGEKATKKESLVALMKKLEDATSFCEYFTINYPLRLKNRQTEIDGLLKAKAILKGGAFAKPEDPNRELKPGDALVQAPKKQLREVRKH